MMCYWSCIYNTYVKTVLELGTGQGKPVGHVLETSMEMIYKGAQPSERQELRDIEPKYPNICVCLLTPSDPSMCPKQQR
jgi:hypothetical protein